MLLSVLFQLLQPSALICRPWKPYASVTYIHCFIGQHIKAEGWSNWNNTENNKTARYGEYKNYGASVDPSKRVNWSRQLSDEEAAEITPQKIFGDWFTIPVK